MQGNDDCKGQDSDYLQCPYRIKIWDVFRGQMETRNTVCLHLDKPSHGCSFIIIY